MDLNLLLKKIVSYNPKANLELIKKAYHFAEEVMTGELRVLLIKLADKLHNLRTISYLPPEKQKKVAKEVLELYAPLAYRLGIDKIKGEMEDLAFRCLEPEKYKELEKKLMQSREEKIG